ncbi:Rrf2 family transcriptional regulator [Ruminococcaceae bacterium OttesenSCG-928-D13]|nr:Rrf2 family transcriptional regulator [Ruminococcaceae bacterium OttesenSCG-928-D13]
MYITQEADYAIRIVRCLAKCGQRRDARSISEEVNVTLRFSLKILGKLSGAGIVRSFKGNRGGYELAHQPADITLKDVLGAVEGPYAMSRCVGGEGDCNCGVTSNCAVQNTFKRISDSINTQLDAVNFETILEEEGCGCGC